MVKSKVNEITDFLVKLNICKEEDRETLNYGFLGLIKHLINNGTTIIVGLCFGMLFESLFFLIAYSQIRTYAGGYHMKSAVNCYFLSTGIIIAVLFVLKLTTLEITGVLSVIFLIISFPIIFRLSPVEASSRPLDETELIYFRKIARRNLLIEAIALLVMISLGLSYWAYIISIGLIVSAIMVVVQKMVIKYL